MQTTAEIAGAGCLVQMVEGVWPKPLDNHVWKDQRLIVSMLLPAPHYRAEAHFAGTAAEYQPVGPLFMVPPDCELIGRGTGGRFRALRCVFDSDAAADLDAGRLTSAQLGKSLNLGTGLTTLLMHRLLQEMEAPGFAASAYVESLSATLRIECMRQLRGLAPERPEQAGLQPRHMRMIDAYLEGSAQCSPSIQEIARICGFNPHYFCKLFRHRTGQSLGRYIAEFRLRRAETMLARSDLPLKEIAFRLGFANAANFSTAFRTGRGMAPGAYRQEMRPRLHRSG